MIKVYYEDRGEHVRTRWFDGPDEEHLACVGTLCFSSAGWAEFTMGMIENQTGGLSNIVVEGTTQVGVVAPRDPEFPRYER